jgi:PhnB protein
MSESVKIIPDNYHSINTYLVIRNAERAIEFYKKAFGAEERFRMHGPDGKTIMHNSISFITHVKQPSTRNIFGLA